jgi:hypothetical protein
MTKDIFYSICCLAFTIIIGGAVYEHLNIVPTWAAAPPVSLSMFQGEYGLKPALFWMIIHPVNLILFALTLVFHWKSDRKKNILLVLASYIIILIITSAYFVPELISITTTPLSHGVSPDLGRRAKTWELLSIARLVVLILLAIALFLGLTKGNKSIQVSTDNIKLKKPFLMA